MRRFAVAAALLTALITTAADARRTQDPLAGRTAGKPVNCLFVSSTTGPTIVDQGTILYRQGARIWRTGPIGACPALTRPPVTLIVDIFGGQLCRNDRFRVLEAGLSIPSAPCRFDAFTPYDKAPVAR